MTKNIKIKPTLFYILLLTIFEIVQATLFAFLLFLSAPTLKEGGDTGPNWVLSFWTICFFYYQSYLLTTLITIFVSLHNRIYFPTFKIRFILGFFLGGIMNITLFILSTSFIETIANFNSRTTWYPIIKWFMIGRFVIFIILEPAMIGFYHIFIKNPKNS